MTLENLNELVSESAKMTDEQLNVLVSEIKKVAEYIGIELTIKQQKQ
jgi:predicted metal-dependent peptidase